MRRSDFNYTLPQSLIAQHPPRRRGDSRLLCLGSGGDLKDSAIGDFPELLRSNDLVVFNDTRVIPARLFGEKETGGRVEILLERLLDEHRFLAQLRVSKPPKAGAKIRVESAGQNLLEVEARESPFFRLRVNSLDPESSLSALELFERAGHIPLPPYIERQDETLDRERYQTVLAREPGAVAAPTAGLHFDEALLARMRASGAQIETLTLHVGAGTFQPIREDDLSLHQMHAEHYRISPSLKAAFDRTKAVGGRVVAIGTTSLRALESATDEDGQLSAGAGESRLFITPGYCFRAVDALLTNFHLPESTLLMLVCAFVGSETAMRAYRHAVDERYRFFSYGDAMWIPQRGETIR